MAQDITVKREILIDADAQTLERLRKGGACQRVHRLLRRVPWLRHQQFFKWNHRVKKMAPGLGPFPPADGPAATALGAAAPARLR